MKVVRVESTSAPGATMSGLKRVSPVAPVVMGPRLEKSVSKLAVSLSGDQTERWLPVAPTVRMFLAVAGWDTVSGPGPALPAEATMR